MFQNNSSPTTSQIQNDLTSVFINSLDISKLMSFQQVFNSSSNDSAVNLLIALKPMLCTEKQIKIDDAIQFMKIIKLLPILSDSGLLGVCNNESAKR
jgi:hypothetical protein